MKFLRTTLLLLGLAGSSWALADMQPPGGNDAPPPPAMSHDGHDGHHHHPGPPPEALAACKGLSAGAKTSLKTPAGNTLQGSCQLVFVPDMKAGGDMPPPPPHGAAPTGQGGW